MSDTIFVDGIRWFDPREGAPDFIKGAISIEPMKLLEWLKANKHMINDKGYLMLDVKVSRENKTYLSVNNYKP